MRLWRYSLVFAWVFAVVGTAQADLSFTRVQVTSVRSMDEVDASSTAANRLAVANSSSMFPADLDAKLPADLPVAVEESQVRSLPGLPGSASLFLSAMLSVGAWHALRSAKHVHLGHLPEWYHTGAPDQIGHAVAIDLQYAPVALCQFDRPVGNARPLLYRVVREVRARCPSRSYLVPAEPRGPPASA